MMNSADCEYMLSKTLSFRKVYNQTWECAYWLPDTTFDAITNYLNSVGIDCNVYRNLPGSLVHSSLILKTAADEAAFIMLISSLKNQ